MAEEFLKEFAVPPDTNVPSFAQGLEILLVDDDTLSLLYISSLLEEYSYKVTTAEQASIALSMLREPEHNFRLVIANVTMDNFSNLHEMKQVLPVVVMSTDGNVVNRAIPEGARYFLQKPMQLKALKPVWQYADWNRKGKNIEIHLENVEENGNNNMMQPQGIRINKTTTLTMLPMEGNIIKEASGKFRPPSGGIRINEIGDSLCPIDAQNTKTSKKQGANLKRPLGEKEGNKEKKKMKTNLETVNSGSLTSNGDGKKNNGGKNSTPLKRTCVWSPELHQKFVEAFEALGEEFANPKMIQEKMNAEGITRRQIGSHLQKYKAQKKKRNGTAGITSSPTENQPIFSQAMTASASPLSEKNPQISQPGKGTMNFKAAGASQSIIPRQPTQPELPRLNDAGNRDLPSLIKSYCTPSPFSLPFERQNSAVSQDGHRWKPLNFGVAGTSQSIIPKSPTQPEVNEHRNEAERIDEFAALCVPFRGQSSSTHAGTSFSPSFERPSSLLSQNGGVVGNTTTSKPQNQPEANVGSSVGYGQRKPHQYSGQMGSSSNSNSYHRHIPNGMRIESHRMLKNLSQRRTSSFGMNEKGKGKQPLRVKGNVTRSPRVNFPNVLFKPPTALAPHKSAGTQASELNLPNSNNAPPRTASPYVSAGTQASELNLPNSNFSPPRAVSPYVLTGTQASEVNSENLRYASPGEPSPYMAAGTQVLQVNLPMSYAPPIEPTPYVAADTRASEMNLPNSSYAAPSAPPLYISTGIQVPETNLAYSSHAPPMAPSPFVSADTRAFKRNISSSTNMPQRAPSPDVPTSVFLLPDSPILLDQMDDFLEDVASILHSQNPLSIGDTRPLNYVPPLVKTGLSGVTNEVINHAPVINLSDGIQNLDPIMNLAPEANSPSQNQYLLSEYDDILRILDEDAANVNDFVYGPNLDADSLEWLKKKSEWEERRLTLVEQAC
ncbi:hypothetical protein TIFTF001_007883 [Ficus carica]|uniref:Two-component response regulator n=1 Tax=Ficus carica TaxID=3494 RepID=A0AA88D2E1_FICCA|nr:hypothetical protein TIFTF001_007883 [Ficus carica]